MPVNKAGSQPAAKVARLAGSAPVCIESRKALGSGPDSRTVRTLGTLQCLIAAKQQGFGFSKSFLSDEKLAEGAFAQSSHEMFVRQILCTQFDGFAQDLFGFVAAAKLVENQTPFAKRAAFATNFTQRIEFTNIYGAMSNTTFVNTLMSGGQGQAYNLTSITTPDPAAPDGSTKVTLTTADLINRLNAATMTRSQVLRAIVQSDQITQNLESVNAFVASQYYGYLRRTPDAGGFNGWVTYLRNNPTDFRTMVHGFLNSSEYRLRFGP